MVLISPQEPGGLETFKVISSHAPPAGVMLTFGKNAGYGVDSPPPPATPMNIQIHIANPHMPGCLDVLLIL